MKAAARAIRDNPSWARQTKEWLRVALWAFGYTEDVPDRHAVAKALLSDLSLTRCRQVSEGGVMGVAQEGRAEAELTRMIEKRSRKGERDPDELDPGYMKSVEACNDKRWQMARLEWHAFHCGQAARRRATLQALIEHHEEQAEKYLPKGAA